jgi:hypothetical protein
VIRALIPAGAAIDRPRDRAPRHNPDYVGCRADGIPQAHAAVSRGGVDATLRNPAFALLASNFSTAPRRRDNRPCPRSRAAAAALPAPDRAVLPAG